MRMGAATTLGLKRSSTLVRRRLPMSVAIGLERRSTSRPNWRCCCGSTKSTLLNGWAVSTMENPANPAATARMVPAARSGLLVRRGCPARWGRLVSRACPACQGHQENPAGTGPTVPQELPVSAGCRVRRVSQEPTAKMVLRASLALLGYPECQGKRAMLANPAEMVPTGLSVPQVRRGTAGKRAMPVRAAV